MVIATIALAQGFNVKTLIDSIQLGIATTLNQLVQQEGRVGRDLVTLARGIVLAQAKVIESADIYMKGVFCFRLVSSSFIANLLSSSRPSRTTNTRIELNQGKEEEGCESCRHGSLEGEASRRKGLYSSLAKHHIA